MYSVHLTLFDRMDQTDGIPLPPTKIPKLDKDEYHYKMDHKKRGRAIVINNKNFDNKKYERLGADTDLKNVETLLESMNFEVTEAEDYEKSQIETLVQNMSKEDHTDYDCFLLIVMTHGANNKLYAKDYDYDVDTIWKYFTPDQCPSLAGKPKIFFVNACRGGKFDDGVLMHTDGGHFSEKEQKLPIMADFLIVYSTFEGFKSWRNPEKGSWYIQALCKILKDHVYERDFLSALTIVNRHVAFNYQSNLTEDGEFLKMKQIPTITSTLTKDIIFKKMS